MEEPTQPKENYQPIINILYSVLNYVGFGTMLLLLVAGTIADCYFSVVPLSDKQVNFHTKVSSFCDHLSAEYLPEEDSEGSAVDTDDDDDLIIRKKK